MTTNRGVWSDELCCHWSAWRVVDETTLALDLGTWECCDMSGAIRLAQGLLPGVQRILTYAGVELDTVYVRQSGDEWQALVRAS